MDDTNKSVGKKNVCDAVIKNILTKQVKLKHVNFDNYQVWMFDLQLAKCFLLFFKYFPVFNSYFYKHSMTYDILLI